MAANRIYVVGGIDKRYPESFTEPQLVRASSQAQAVGHIVRGKYHAKVAKQDDLERLLGEGHKVESASSE